MIYIYNIYCDITDEEHMNLRVTHTHTHTMIIQWHFTITISNKAEAVLTGMDQTQAKTCSQQAQKPIHLYK